MNRNRFLALALCGALSLSLLTACGGKTEPTPAPETTQPAVAETAPVATAPVAEPTQAPAQETPAAAPAQGGEVSMEALWDTLSDGLDLPMLMDLDADLLAAIYGLDAGILDSYVAKMPMMNAQATEFFIAKVQSGKMADVKAAIAKRHDDLDAQWSTYLPEQYDLVNNYKLVENGDYVMFAVTEFADTVVDRFNAATK